MKKYTFLVIIYLISVVSSSIASALNIDVQKLYRIPLVNIRWIDVAIIVILVGFLINILFRERTLKNTGLLVGLCLFYFICEVVQLARSLGAMDIPTQISLFFCTLSIFIVVDLSMYSIPLDKLVPFLRRFAILGACTLIVTNGYLMYSFFTGRVVFEDLDIRVAIEVIGTKESVYSFVIIPFVYAVGLYLIQGKGKLWEKVLFFVAIFSIYGGLVITFWRGTLMMILVVTLYFIFVSSSAKQIVLKTSGLMIFIFLGYFIFGESLAEKGYDPVKKIMETAEFATDVDNPDWDKGRKAAQEFAINEWKNNFWIGAGYDALGHNTALPVNSINPHNGIITSLFHRGVLGTILLALIYILLFRNAVRCWLLLSNFHFYESEMLKLLILVSFFWLITFMTQEALWEKYSLSIEFLYLGLITNFYKQETAT